MASWFRPLRSDAGKTARFALGLLAVLVLLLNFGGWALIQSLTRAQEEMLEQGVATSASLIASAIPPGALTIIEASLDRQTGRTDFDSFYWYLDPLIPSAEELQRSILEANSGNAFTVQILSPAGELLLDSDGYKIESTTPDWLAVDLDLIAEASAGRPVTSEDSDKDPTKRAYQALLGTDGDVVAVLRVEASRDYIMAPRVQARQLTVAAIASTAVILLLWWTLSKVIRRAARAERLADQSDRLRALGTVTAGLAHEIRNPLSIIHLSAEELKVLSAQVRDEKTRSELLRTVSDLQGESRRLKELTDQFLDFSRERPSQDDSVTDLHQTLERTVSLFRKSAPPGLAVGIERGPANGAVVLSENRLRQVLLNLLRNAQEALEGRGDGRIHVRSRRERDQAVIEVEDNGPGMDRATLQQAFDPFFTTRADGTGLGLSLSRAVVEAAGGQLLLVSEKGRGTTVFLRLPLQSRV